MVISKKGRNLWLRICALHYAMSSGIVCTHWFTRSKTGAELDYGNTRAKMFDIKCPDEGRVCIHGEILEDR